MVPEGKVEHGWWLCSPSADDCSHGFIVVVVIVMKMNMIVRCVVPKIGQGPEDRPQTLLIAGKGSHCTRNSIDTLQRREAQLAHRLHMR
jgi:hypothetical protein